MTALLFTGLTDPAMACTSLLGAWQLLQSHAQAAYERGMADHVSDGDEVNIP